VIKKELERHEGELVKEKQLMVDDEYTSREIMNDPMYNRTRGKVESLEFVIKTINSL
jgi:hypothetical protein